MSLGTEIVDGKIREILGPRDRALVVELLAEADAVCAKATQKVFPQLAALHHEYNQLIETAKELGADMGPHARAPFDVWVHRLLAGELRGRKL